MDHDRLADHVERSQSIIESSPQLDEENTKTKLVTPLLEALGWDIYSPEVELEYTISIANTSVRVDYALNLDGSPVVFVEAKGLDTTLAPDHRDQLGDYMQQRDITWGVLTNGRTIEILRRDEETAPGSGMIIGKLDVTEIDTVPPALRVISKPVLESDQAGDIAARLAAKRRAVQKLRSEKLDLASHLTQTVSEWVEEPIGQEIESTAKAFVDDLIETLQDQTAAKGGASMGGDDGGGTPAGTYVVRLTAGETLVKRLGADTQSAVMAAVVRFLLTEYDLLEMVELPYVYGETKALLSDDSVHPDGAEFRQPHEITDGVYLETHASGAGKQRRLKDLAGTCGLGIEFGDGW